MKEKKIKKHWINNPFSKIETLFWLGISCYALSKEPLVALFSISGFMVGIIVATNTPV